MVKPSEFPHLFRQVNWGTIRCTFELSISLPQSHLISNINLVPFVGDRCVVIMLQGGQWEIPGGTLEPGEDHMDCLRRELLEEAGASLVTFQAIGYWHCLSSSPKPYRPHLPHPESFRLVGRGQVQLVSEPLVSAGAERIVAVDVVTVEEAYERFASIDRLDLAELYKVAALLGQE